MRSGSWTGLVASFGMAAMGSAAHGHILYFFAPLTGSQVVPPTGSAARGTAMMAFDHHGGLIDMTVRIQGVSVADIWSGGPNGHSAFLGIGDRGVAGDYAIDLQWLGASFYQDGDELRLDVQDVFIGGIQGDLESDPGANVEALFSNRMYIEVLTSSFPTGELRGQFHFTRLREFEAAEVFGPVPTPGAAAALSFGLIAAAGRRRR